jgi:hypothetical protein
MSGGASKRYVLGLFWDMGVDNNAVVDDGNCALWVQDVQDVRDVRECDHACDVVTAPSHPESVRMSPSREAVRSWTHEEVAQWGAVVCKLSPQDMAVLRLRLTGKMLLGYPVFPLTKLVGDLTVWGMSAAGADAIAAAYQAQRWAAGP